MSHSHVDTIKGKKGGLLLELTIPQSEAHPFRRTLINDAMVGV